MLTSRSTLGKKFALALSGLALMLFLVAHLAGNFLLYLPSGTTFNNYADILHSNVAIFYGGEIAIAAIFLFHIIIAIQTAMLNRKARPVRYMKWKSKDNDNTPSGPASRSMAITGLVMLVFLILHVKQFRFGPGEAEGYVAFGTGGKRVYDLHRLVAETFHQPLFVAIYVLALLFVGTHLRHGFWSAFQSLGAMHPALSKPLRVVGLAIATMMALGFLLIPLWIYFQK